MPIYLLWARLVLRLFIAVAQRGKHPRVQPHVVVAALVRRAALLLVLYNGPMRPVRLVVRLACVRSLGLQMSLYCDNVSCTLAPHGNGFVVRKG
jgi:hypothetical protein